MVTKPKGPRRPYRRPYRLPNGISPDQARAAGIVLCAHARDQAEATGFLQLAGLLRDPAISNDHLGNPSCKPVVVKL